MKATFRLAPVLRVRRIQEEIAKAALGEARGARDLAETEADARRTPLSKHDPPDRSTGTALLASLASGLSMAADLASARSALAAAEADADDAARNWSGAAGRLRALESLEERHRKAALAERWRVEQREIDERATAAAGPSRNDLSRDDLSVPSGEEDDR